MYEACLQTLIYSLDSPQDEQEPTEAANDSFIAERFEALANDASNDPWLIAPQEA